QPYQRGDFFLNCQSPPKSHLYRTLLERESEIASHQTGRNSGVIHAGVYYRPGSLKAQLTQRGRTLLFAFLDAYGIPYQLSGKLIVAVSPDELPRLYALYRTAQTNQVPGLTLLEHDAMREVEPHVVGQLAIHSPKTGIVFFPDVANKLRDLLQAAGHHVQTGTTVTRMVPEGGWVRVHTNHGAILCRHVIAAAGIQSDKLAEGAGLNDPTRMVPFRGDYLVLSPAKDSLVRSLIYPVPDPRLPFLGVHFTRRLREKEVWIGPNAVLAFDRMRPGRGVFNLPDFFSTVTFPGFWRLARHHWRTAIGEWYRDHWAEAYLRLAQRYIPELQPTDVHWGPSGIRAQLVDNQGGLLDDFRFLGNDRLMFVLNAPSPGATSALAIGEYVVEHAAQQFGWTLGPRRL
ncbi:L-2-hydroxyglutarate oxidase, partial [Sulfobacillus harzensis]